MHPEQHIAIPASLSCTVKRVNEPKPVYLFTRPLTLPGYSPRHLSRLVTVPGKQP